MEAAPTILSCLRETVRRFPDRPAVSDAERTLTYRELWQEAEREGMRLMGEEKVKVKGEDEVEKRGGGGQRNGSNSIVSLNLQPQPDYEVEKAKGITRGQANLVEARPTVSFVIAVIGTYLAGRVFVPCAKDAPAAVIARIERETETSFGPDIADVLHTTGTTGTSKGVTISHRAAWAAADNNRHFDRITEETVYLIASPLNHVSALRKLEACLLAGAHAVLQDGFVDVKRYYDAIERHRVNALLLPPSAALLLLRVSRDKLHSLADQIKVVHSNGAPMPEALKESLRRCLPRTRLVFAYGATEAGSACCAYDYAEFPGKANCVGKASPHVNITVEDGCIVVSGDTVMDGYLEKGISKKEEERSENFATSQTSQTLKPVHHTHDLGRIDDDGFVYVFGRKDDVINCGGMKVAPTEVEEVAMRCQEIADCVCFGVPDPLTGNAVKLMVVPNDAKGFDLSAFRLFLQKRLERHYLPTQIACVAKIPMTQNGKPDRTRLR